ncbi:MAG: mechanosensitive ion channel family protein [Rhodosalinus sp.]
MESDAANPANLAGALRDLAARLAAEAGELTEFMLRPWNAYQVAIAAGLFLLAWALRAVLAPRMHAWMRAREGWPLWRLRVLIVLHKRLRMVFFVVLLWAAVWAMRELALPSRSWLLAIFANLSLAWLVVAFATRLIANSLVRKTVRYGAYAWVTLRILGLTDETERLLGRIAVELGEVRISLWMVLQGVFLLALLLFLARVIARESSARIYANEELNPSLRVLAVKFLQVSLYGAAFLLGLRAVGFDLTGLAVLSGAIGVGLGFGLQKVVSNLVSGVILLLDRSIKPGDVISLGETFGWINSLGARYVSITTRDGKEYLIPNEDLITGQVVNWSHSNDLVRLDIHFGTAYGDDPHEVRRVAKQAARGVARVLEDRPPVCHITGFGDSSVDYVLRFWIRDPSGGITNIRGNVYLALWDAFQENGIRIPFPQREVRLLEGSEVLTRRAE